jgi:hypothetical protein
MRLRKSANAGGDYLGVTHEHLGQNVIQRSELGSSAQAPIMVAPIAFIRPGCGQTDFRSS